jgi:hypothetical protein
MTRQGPGVPGLRLARHPGHGPGLRHQQPRRLPPARLHRGPRCWASRSRPIRWCPRASPTWSRPSRTPPPPSTPPAPASSPPSPGAWPTCRPRWRHRLRRRLDAWRNWPDRRAHLEHGAPVQQCRRLHRQGRRPAEAPEDRRPKGWSRVSRRCCPSTTRPVAGTPRAYRPRRPWRGSACNSPLWRQGRRYPRRLGVVA